MLAASVAVRPFGRSLVVVRYQYVVRSGRRIVYFSTAMYTSARLLVRTEGRPGKQKRTRDRRKREGGDGVVVVVLVKHGKENWGYTEERVDVYSVLHTGVMCRPSTQVR